MVYTKNFKKDFIFLRVSSIMVCNIRRIGIALGWGLKMT